MAKNTSNVSKPLQVYKQNSVRLPDFEYTLELVTKFPAKNFQIQSKPWTQYRTVNGHTYVHNTRSLANNLKAKATTQCQLPFSVIPN